MVRVMVRVTAVVRAVTSPVAFLAMVLVGWAYQRVPGFPGGPAAERMAGRPPGGV